MSASKILSIPQIVFGVILGSVVMLDWMNVIALSPTVQFFVTTFFLAVWMFTAGIHAKQMAENDMLDGFLKWTYAPLVICVLLLDVIFNFIWGSLIFREVPKEWLFTKRVSRHLRTGNKKVALTWANRLNKIDPGHVDIFVTNGVDHAD